MIPANGSTNSLSTANRSIGFPKSNALHGPRNSASPNSKPTPATGAQPAATTAVLPKRPKGRWFVASVILTILGFILNFVWQELLHFQAYGQIEGRVLQLVPIASGTISAMYVNDGDVVQAGQLLARVENYELQRERLRLDSELRIALSGLEVRLAEVRLSQQNSVQDQLQRQAEYHRLAGDLKLREARLQELKQAYEGHKKLAAQNIVTATDLLTAQSNFEGQLSQVENLRKALQVLETAVASDQSYGTQELISSEVAKLHELKEQLQQVQAFSEAAEIRAPVSGRVVRRFHFTGEYVRQSDPVFELYEEGSISATLYFTQAQMHQIRIGDEIQLVIRPNSRAIPFRVERVASQVTEPPNSLMRYYSAHQTLVPVHAVPVSDTQHAAEKSLAWIGAEVGLPRFFAIRRGPVTTDVSLNSPLSLKPQSAKPRAQISHLKMFSESTNR